MPVFPRQPTFVQPSVTQPANVPPPSLRQPPARQPVSRGGRNDIYLPPMPEMLKTSTPPYRDAPATAVAVQQASPPRRPLNANDPPPVVRGQIDDSVPRAAEPVSTPVVKLVMPTPEELGLTRGLPQRSGQSAAAVQPSPAAQPTGVDWNALRTHLDSLGAVYYRLEKREEGGYAFLCGLPHSGSQTKHRHFQAIAASEREAVEAVLGEISRWRSSRE